MYCLQNNCLLLNFFVKRDCMNTESAIQYSLYSTKH